MLGGIAFQLREYYRLSSASVFIIILKFLLFTQSLLSYTHSALENFSYDICGNDPSVLQNQASIKEMPLNQIMIQVDEER